MTAAVADHDTIDPTRRGARLATPTAPRPRLVPVPDSEPPLERDFAPDPRRANGIGGTGLGAGRPASVPATGADAEPATGAASTAAADPRAVPAAGAIPAVDRRRAPVRPTPTGPAGPLRPAGRIPRARLAGAPTRPAAPSLAQRPNGGTRRHGFRVAVVSARSVPGWSEETDTGVRMTSTISLPPARPVGATLARGLLEVLSGSRPIEQLRPHCAPDVFAGLADAPMLDGRDAVRLITTMVCEPADGVAEVSAVFRCAGVVRAMALRLQGVDGRWRVTALHLG